MLMLISKCTTVTLDSSTREKLNERYIRSGFFFFFLVTCLQIKNNSRIHSKSYFWISKNRKSRFLSQRNFGEWEIQVLLFRLPSEKHIKRTKIPSLLLEINQKMVGNSVSPPGDILEGKGNWELQMWALQSVKWRSWPLFQASPWGIQHTKDAELSTYQKLGEWHSPLHLLRTSPLATAVSL